MKRLTLTLVLILNGLVSSGLYAQYIIGVNIVDEWPNSRYIVDAVKGIAIDTKTSLMWRRCVQGLSSADCSSGTAQTYTWAEALAVPAVANAEALGGYTGWRLPNLKELATLTATNRRDPARNRSIFPSESLASNYIWSSTPSTTHTNSALKMAWTIRTLNGVFQAHNRQIPGFVSVQLVRDNLPPRYIVNKMSPGDTVRTVTDTTTGLMWKQCAEGLSSTDCGSNTSSVHSFSEAEQLAQDDRTGGYGDWRVPTKDELKGLIFTSTGSPHIDKDIFPNTPANAFWTSTRNGDIAAWQVDFLDATEYYGYVSEADSVRLVRNR